jgi:hypothetical protein
MNDQLVAQNIIESVVIEGDLSRLTPEQRVEYYLRVCNNLGLNPLLRPFNYITIRGKLILYPTKTCHSQLRENRNVSIDDLDIKEDNDNITVIVKGHDSTGRTDVEIAVVSKKDMGGDYGNNVMKCVTKGKNRLTLSLCGLGMPDETELETIPEVRKVNVNIETGEIVPQAVPERMTTGQGVDVSAPLPPEPSAVKPKAKSSIPPPPDPFPMSEFIEVKPGEVKDHCELHDAIMKEYTKGDSRWYSHKTDSGAWCSGKPALPSNSLAE